MESESGRWIPLYIESGVEWKRCTLIMLWRWKKEKNARTMEFTYWLQYAQILFPEIALIKPNEEFLFDAVSNFRSWQSGNWLSSSLCSFWKKNYRFRVLDVIWSNQFVFLVENSWGPGFPPIASHRFSSAYDTNCRHMILRNWGYRWGTKQKLAFGSLHF